MKGDYFFMGNIIAFLTVRKELLFTSLVLFILCLFIGLSYYGYTNLNQKITNLYSLVDSSSKDLLSLEEDEVTSSNIYVEIKGSVKNPGVYQMTKDSRVFELIEQAGGTTSLADTSNLNLSMLLEDAMVIYVYSKEELQEETLNTEDNSQNFNSSSSKEEVATTKEDGKIAINKASLEELITLPGIGEVKAQAIIDYRKEYGQFNSLEELKNVSGIGEATYEKIKDYLKL